MVKFSSEWSGRKRRCCDVPSLYHKLSRTKDLRQAAYVELFRAHNDGYLHCIQITFENEEGRQNYLPHPEHETLKKKFTDVLEKIVVFDYSI
jgi:hypothetical protein